MGLEAAWEQIASAKQQQLFCTPQPSSAVPWAGPLLCRCAPVSCPVPLCPAPQLVILPCATSIPSCFLVSQPICQPPAPLPSTSPHPTLTASQTSPLLHIQPGPWHFPASQHAPVPPVPLPVCVLGCFACLTFHLLACHQTSPKPVPPSLGFPLSPADGHSSPLRSVPSVLPLQPLALSISPGCSHLWKGRGSPGRCLPAPVAQLHNFQLRPSCAPSVLPSGAPPEDLGGSDAPAPEPAPWLE